jgi:hypothetical protein
MFGSPTSVLYRMEAVKDRNHLFTEGRLHEDTELAYELLKNWNFGFVHEILSFLRKDDYSISGAVKHYEPNALDKFIIINMFGNYYINENFDLFYKEAKHKYYNQLAQGATSRYGHDFLRYHLKGLHDSGIDFDKWQFIKCILWVVVDLLLNPKKSLGKLYRYSKQTLMK